MEMTPMGLDPSAVITLVDEAVADAATRGQSLSSSGLIDILLDLRRAIGECRDLEREFTLIHGGPLGDA
jgi:hypothetical protein